MAKPGRIRRQSVVMNTKRGPCPDPLSVGIATTFTNVAAGCSVSFTALIEGRTTASAWDFADGVTVSNRPYATHAWAVPGDYAVVLRAYNASAPAGVNATVTVHVVMQPVHYAAIASANPVPPYTSWATAATNIQDAVDAAVPGVLVLVGNGVYATGGRALVGTLTNRVAVDKPLTVRSVNGSQFTVIKGYQVPGTTNSDDAIRCVYLANGAILSGFTLTNGATLNAGYYDSHGRSGGGVWCESGATVVSNCVVAGNSASRGGGAAWGTLSNCKLAGNSADESGGGAYGGVMNNCTLAGNSADFWGGRARVSTLNNCTLIGNSANPGGGGAMECTLQNCTLTGNRSTGTDQGDVGGGAAHSTLNNCTLIGNSARNSGGGGG